MCIEVSNEGGFLKKINMVEELKTCKNVAMGIAQRYPGRVESPHKETRRADDLY